MPTRLLIQYIDNDTGLSAGPLPPRLLRHNTFESRSGNHVVLEFADPTTPSQVSPCASPLPRSPVSPSLARTVSTFYPTPSLLSPRYETPPITRTISSPGGGSQTRLQMTFEAIKKLSAGLASPRIEFGIKRNGEDKGRKSGSTGERNSTDSGPGYFDVLP